MPNVECAWLFWVTLIDCGDCNSRYHPTRVCLGLPDSVIGTMKEYSGSRDWRREMVVMDYNLAASTYPGFLPGGG